MKIDDLDFRQQIYELASGVWNLDEHPVPQSAFVENAFTEGSDCSLAYSQMLDAYSRLCLRLHVKELEDTDIEIIINNLLSIGNDLALKMFEYGVFFARNEDLASE